MLWALLFSSIGLGYFIYGRKQDNKVVLWSGVGLMVYPYFFNNVYWIVGVGLGLALLPKIIKL